MKKAYIGIDPGKTGFITIFKEDGDYTFFPMPTHKVETGHFLKSGKKEMKPVFYKKGLLALALTLREELKDYSTYIGFEDIVGRQGWSAQVNLEFGKVIGLLEMVCMIIGGDITIIRPQKWQSVMYQGFKKVKKPSSTGKTMIHDTKATSKLVAQTLAPNIDFRKTKRSTKIDDNKTDSFLICKYMLRYIK